MDADEEYTDEFHQRVIQQLTPADIPTLYHYTSVGAALEILRSRTLWVSSGLTTNDHAEGQWLQHLLDEHYRDEAITAGKSRSVEEETARGILWRHVFAAEVPAAYVACFSETGDQLSQWRGYADDGRGVALGFNVNDRRFPVVTAPPQAYKVSELAYSIVKVDYPRSADIQDVIEIVERAMLAEPIMGEQFVIEQIALSARRWTNKNPAFAEEREWRIVNHPIEPRNLPPGTSISAQGTRRFRANGSRIISYYELPFSESALTSIVLGPRCEMETRELESLLWNYGYAALEPVPSEATYR